MDNRNDTLNQDMISVCSNLSDYYSTGTCLITWMLLPGICGVGFVLNCLAISLFSLAIHRGHRSPMSVYLITLSVFDSVQLLFSIFIITFGGSYFLIAPSGELLVSQQTFNTIDLMRTYATVYVYPLLMAANYGSIWVVTLICVQRYFAICYPLSTAFRTVELPRAVKEVMLISAAALALNACRFWEFRLEYFADPMSGPDDRKKRFYPMINFGPFRNETAHPYYLLAMDGVLYTVLLYAIPFTIVSILNVRIVMAIYRARILNRFIGESSASRGNRREHRSALMVSAIILLFFICYTLAVAERIWSILDEAGANSEFGGFLNAVSNLMVNLNSTIDPLIYFLFSRGFKDLFLKMRKKKYSDVMTAGLLHSRSASLIVTKKTSLFRSTFTTTTGGNNVQHQPSSDSTMRPLLTTTAAQNGSYKFPRRVRSMYIPTTARRYSSQHIQRNHDRLRVSSEHNNNISVGLTGKSTYCSNSYRNRRIVQKYRNPQDCSSSSSNKTCENGSNPLAMDDLRPPSSSSNPSKQHISVNRSVSAAAVGESSTPVMIGGMKKYCSSAYGNYDYGIYSIDDTTVTTYIVTNSIMNQQQLTTDYGTINTDSSTAEPSQHCPLKIVNEDTGNQRRSKPTAVQNLL